MDGGAHLAGDVIFDGADEDGLARGGVEQRFGEECGCGFAVGAGDAGGGELALGMAEECGGGLGERAAAVFDFEDGQAGLVDEQMIEGLRGVGDDAERAGGNGLVDVAIAVGRAAFHGDENRAGTHAARVVFDAGDGRGGVAGGADGGDFGDEIVPVHLVVDCSCIEVRRAVTSAVQLPAAHDDFVCRRAPWCRARGLARARCRCRDLYFEAGAACGFNHSGAREAR